MALFYTTEHEIGLGKQAVRGQNSYTESSLSESKFSSTLALPLQKFLNWKLGQKFLILQVHQQFPFILHLRTTYTA